MINKTDMLADIERVLVPEADIHARIKEVGRADRPPITAANARSSSAF